MNDRDPYSLCYDAIWAALEACEHFTTLVREGNRIKFAGGTRDPMKDQVQAADLPEVRIIARSLHPRQRGSSGTVWKRLVYEIQISTGEKQLDAQLFPVVWAIDIALTKRTQADWKAITWQGHAFIVHAVPQTAGAIGAGETLDAARQITGWSTAYSLEVEMSFPETLLKDY